MPAAAGPCAVSDPGEEVVGRTERRRDRYLRRAWRVALVLLLALFGLILAAAIFARSYLSEDRSRLLAIEVFDQLFQGRLELGSFEWERFPERLHLGEVAVFAPRGEKVITIQELTAEVKLVPLLWKTVHLPEVRLEGVSVELLPCQEEEPAFALIEVFLLDDPGPETDAASPPSGWKVVLSKLAVQELEVVLKVGELSAEVEHASFEAGSLELGLPGAEMRVEKLELPRGRVSWGPEAWVIRPARVDTVGYSRAPGGEDADFTLEGLELETEGLALKGRVRLESSSLIAPGRSRRASTESWTSTRRCSGVPWRGRPGECGSGWRPAEPSTIRRWRCRPRRPPSSWPSTASRTSRLWPEWRPGSSPSRP